MSDSVFGQLEPNDFTFPVYRKIVDAFLEYKKNYPKIMSSTAFCDSLPAELQPACNELYLFSPADLSLDKEVVVRMALEIKRYSLKQQISDLVQNPEDHQKDKDLSIFTTRLKEVEKMISTDYNYNL